MRRALLLAIALVALRADAQSNAARGAVGDSARESSVRAWSGAAESYAYLLGADSYVMPILRVDRAALHLEARYQYEARHSLAAWAGWTFSGRAAGGHLDVVPMGAAIVGPTAGFAPGLEVTLSWTRLEVYSESEYVFEIDGPDGRFYYNWSSLTWQPRSWIGAGVTGQRTHIRGSALTFDRGVFATLSRGPASVSAYGFNLERSAPFAILALAFDF